ncbi:HNH endonuclease [Occultella glacieicola]|uniref:HNH endonuclease n=1 Tax=Occultella glacieicola TaxID=2518684 RepID=A0ABY2E0A4_9MICO|nr:HNH endonuclease signature motif containing protein [Occultella glacieicola]TDE90847.1 HNH endonuclease [Occultella glacieicola]
MTTASFQTQPASRLSDDPGAAPLDPGEVRPLEEIEAELSGLAVKIAASTCRFLLLLAEFDDRQGWNTGGFASCVNWLSWRCGMSATTAREHVRIAHALTVLPGTTAVFAAGHLSFSKVRAITRVATAETEPELLAVAASATANQLERFVAGVRTARSLDEVNQLHGERHLRFREELDGSYSFSGRCSPEDAAVLIEELNRVGDYLKDTDAGHSTDPEPPPWLRESVVHGHALIDALILICEQSVVAHPGHAATTGDQAAVSTGAHTPRGQRRGETVLHVTLDDLANARPAPTDTAGPIEPEVLEPTETADGLGREDTRTLRSDPAARSDDATHEAVEDGAQRGGFTTVTPITGIAGPGASAEAPGADPATAEEDPPDTAKLIGPHLELGPALHPETARRLTCDTGVVTHLHANHTSGFTVVPNARPGRTLEVSPRVRSTNAALRRALWSRDHGCRAPGCHRRAYLHAHHIHHWADGGPTTLTNLVLLCATHHRLLHEGNYDITLREDGTVFFTTPDGRILTSVPTPPVTVAPSTVAAHTSEPVAAPVATTTPKELAGSGPTSPESGAAPTIRDESGPGVASAEASDPDQFRDPNHPLTPIGGGPLHLVDAVSTVMGNWDIHRQNEQARAEENVADGPRTEDGQVRPDATAA